ncbi:MAG: hypothetical protein H7Z76_13520 [Methylotenera sp.]|nr:hypothetical protein [Flavobacterium sp.]
MKIEDEYVVCVASLNEDNTWFIFRNNGVEVKIEKINEKLKSDRKLTDLEVEYLDNNLR